MKPSLLQFIRFCVVGFITFVVDLILIEVIIYVSALPTYAVRCISIPIAMQVAYYLNLTYVFRHKNGPDLRSWARYTGSNFLGVCINYAVFVVVLHQAFETETSVTRLVALMAGTGAGLFFNFWANKRFVFTREKL